MVSQSEWLAAYRCASSLIGAMVCTELHWYLLIALEMVIVCGTSGLSDITVGIGTGWTQS